MSELLDLLDGSIDEVKAGIAELEREDLLALRRAETNGKSRKGVLELLNEVLGPDDELTPLAQTEFDASGPLSAAPEDGEDQDIDLKHPALDADPRANTTAAQNRIDFNDPSLS